MYIHSYNHSSFSNFSAIIAKFQGLILIFIHTPFHVCLNLNKYMSILACGIMDEMIDTRSPPDLVLDMTHGGVNSDVIKSLSFTLGLPTVTSTMGNIRWGVNFSLTFLKIILGNGQLFPKSRQSTWSR